MRYAWSRSAAVVISACGLLILANAQRRSPNSASEPATQAESADIAESQLLQPEELVTLLRSSKAAKPLILQVGFHVLYQQAHIPGSEYVGPGSDAEGIRQLRARVKELPHTQSIVLYCGCCPWTHCPNVRPAYQELRTMGFTNVKVLYIAHDFGTDWVNKGYAVASGQ